MKIFLSVLGLALAMEIGATMAQTAAEREACMADFEKHCPGVQPGGGRVIKCLSSHLDQFTPQYKAVVEANMPQ